MRSLSSHAIVHACRHSPSTKRIIVPLKPTGPAAPGGPGGPGDPGGPWSPFSPRATSFSPQPDTNTDRSAAAMNHLTGMRLPCHLLGQRIGPDAKPRANDALLQASMQTRGFCGALARSLLRSRAHLLGIVYAPNEKAAEAAAIAEFKVDPPAPGAGAGLTEAWALRMTVPRRNSPTAGTF